jgi:hypothetical protein
MVSFVIVDRQGGAALGAHRPQDLGLDAARLRIGVVEVHVHDSLRRRC